MNPTISTPRLHLIRLTDTTPNSHHVQSFHENWSDPAATAWSLSGKTNSVEESRARMKQHLTQNDTMYYAVFVRTEKSKEGEGDDEPGAHVGSVSLWATGGKPTLAPPEIAAVAADKENRSGTGNDQRINLRMLGYALFELAWAKGYATEASKAAIEAYTASVADEKAKSQQTYYIEAGVDKANARSQHVLNKLGFKRLGWKAETEPVFLGGAWREPGYWVYGVCV